MTAANIVPAATQPPPAVIAQPSAGESPMLAAALDYARRGMSVIPCEPRGKKPLLKSWKPYQKRCAAEAEIREWWQRWPDANIGLVTGAVSKLVVLDADGESGIQAVQSLQGMHDVRTPAVKTGKGLHFYFQHPGGPGVRNFAGKLPGLDLRGDGGYVVAPPSVHPSGETYQFVEGYGLAVPLALLPASVRALVETEKVNPESGALDFSSAPTKLASGEPIARYVASAVEREIGRVVAADEGTRNKTLYEAAFNLGQLVGAGALDRADVERRLMIAASRAGLSEKEACDTTNSGLKNGIAKPRDLSKVGQSPSANSANSANRSGAISAIGANGTNGRGEREIPGPDEPFEPLDLGVIDSNRRAAPILPVEVFGAFWGPAIRSAAEAAGAPVDYVGASLLAAAAALIGDSRRVTAWPGWTEPCALWIGLVGNPSSGKSPAKDKVLDLVRAIEREAAADFPARYNTWLELAEAAKATEEKWKELVKSAVAKGGTPPSRPAEAEAPPPPVLPRLIVSDATVEALARLLVAYPRGVLAHFDELARLMGNLDKYGGQGGDRAFWIEAFGGRPFSVDRVKDGAKPIIVPALLITILGAIQPDRLASGLLRSDDDGFAARFLWTWPEAIPPRRPRNKLDTNAMHALLQRLYVLSPLSDSDGKCRPIELPLTVDATDLFSEWRCVHAHGEAERAGALASHFGKMPGLVLRLALVLEHLWWTAGDSPEPRDIARPALEAAIQLVDTYFKPMAERVFGDAGLPLQEKNAATVARWIAREQPKKINARELRRRVRLPGLRESKELSAALGVLGESGWLRRSPKRAGDSPGRAREDYEVNPNVLAALSSRADSADSANRGT